jgi:opacity protein-like surface antigen
LFRSAAPASPDFASRAGNLLAAAETSDQTDQENKMKFKAILAATTACALIAVAPSAKAGDLYVSVFGGLNMVVDSSGATDNPDGGWSSDADTGFVIGGTIGTSLDRWAQGLRVELETSYRRNDLGGSYVEVPDPTETETGILDGNLSTFAVMANVWYEFDIGSKMRPYIGGGAGWARMSGDVAAVETTPNTGSDFGTSNEASGFAWQLGVGGLYEVSPGVDVGIGYRYFNGPAFAEIWEGDVGKIENENHAVQVELKIDIQ